jgi:uncharacterized protein YggE
MDRGTILAVAIAVAVIAGAGTAGVAMALTDSPASPAQTSPATDAGPNGTITVSATGSETADPDKAILRVGVEKSAADPTDARNAVADNVSAVSEALSELGIAEEDVRTTDYRIYQERRDPRLTETEEPSEPIYHARQTIEVHLTDTDGVGEVIDTTVEAGATEVRDVRFTLTEETRNELQNDALEGAMDRAREQADTLANASEMTISGPQEITTDSGHVPIVAYQTEAAGAAATSTSIEPGPVSVETHVTVTYEAAR